MKGGKIIQSEKMVIHEGVIMDRKVFSMVREYSEGLAVGRDGVREVSQDSTKKAVRRHT